MLDAAQNRRDSAEPGNNRNVGGVMGKNDFLLLLAAQLRHQDPLNPQTDGEFASQLAQFSSLEQMQNMNESLSAMANYQAYSLVGKYVIAESYLEVNGVYQLSEIPGIVDSVFSKDGRMFAQIGIYTVPISSITEVFDSSVLLSSDSLLQASNNLIGRTVQAQLGDTVLEGVVTRVNVTNGVLYAQIDDGTGVTKFVPVGSIFDIREPGTPGDKYPGETGKPGETGGTDEPGDVDGPGETGGPGEPGDGVPGDGEPGDGGEPTP